MKLTGHCYCGALRYETGGDPLFKGQCHCRECQYISGGMPAVVMGVKEAEFRYTQGKPKGFRRSDLAEPGDARVLPGVRHARAHASAGACRARCCSRSARSTTRACSASRRW